MRRERALLLCALCMTAPACVSNGHGGLAVLDLAGAELEAAEELGRPRPPASLPRACPSCGLMAALTRHHDAAAARYVRAQQAIGRRACAADAEEARAETIRRSTDARRRHEQFYLCAARAVRASGDAATVGCLIRAAYGEGGSLRSCGVEAAPECGPEVPALEPWDVALHAELRARGLSDEPPCVRRRR